MAVVAMTAMLGGQVTSKSEKIAGTSTYETEALLTGQVVWVQGDWLVAKMEPTGNLSIFHVQPGREFMIDGQSKHIGDLQPGTVLTATVVTKTTPVTLRTTSVLNGTVWWVSGNYVILTLENGENKGYNVPESFKFTVEGKSATVNELKPGMKVTATKIVEEPQTVMSTKTTITGKAPKDKN
jgi:hypothetical protein